MKYDIVQDRRMLWRVSLYPWLSARTVLALIFFVIVGVFLFMTSSAVEIASYFGLFVALIVFALVVSVGYNRTVARTYGDKDGKVVWSYDLQPDTLTISIADKVKLTFEKEGLKKATVHKHGVLFRHKRSPFYIFFPEGKAQEVTDYLKANGWVH